MVLTRGDEYPIHQTPEPVAYAGTDRNFYDRYFFNGYAPDGSGFFAAAFGVYPHLDVADAHFSFIRGGVQHCLHASCELGMERMGLKVGPIAIEVIEPLKRLKVTIEETEGLAGEFIFTARGAPIEEPRFIHRIGPRAFMDYTRMTQNGHYEGWIEADGVCEDMNAGTMGTRDRSWGVRPVGARDEQPNPSAPLPSFFWQWTPLNIEGGSLFFHVNADPDGRAWNTRAAFAPDGCGQDAVAEGEGSLTARLERGSRWPAGASLEIDVPGAPRALELAPIARFQMKGIGYTHPEWGHGLHHGPLRVEREDLMLAELDPAAMDNLHVQMLCRVSGEANGMGVFEQLAIGPYAPLGLAGIADPA
ncbi:hypothetical protein Ga0102493_112823 [Erythrobacter litoralis]|uniref:AttH domain-containing protein n=1 Tax=Erythrobacter litoralis TaxID=39960 RepID=A0A074MZ41_9SPHN|nr:hypothetical protein [Erythrobacter litoralis]AOL23828.1 hypothetical protein Ga0102493_112823 [Erythrobacter litoralis]KEO98689.1 hypothetical protein EH32_06175 [Erythrobacter litoralis]